MGLSDLSNESASLVEDVQNPGNSPDSMIVSNSDILTFDFSHINENGRYSKGLMIIHMLTYASRKGVFVHIQVFPVPN